jgi:hypothetical protein
VEPPGGPPDDRPRVGEVVVRRAFDGQRNLLIARGNFAGFLAGYREHVARWELETDGLLDVMMRQGLAGLTLHLTARPEDESVGFTVNIRHPAINLFLTGDAVQSWLTGRAITEGVRTADTSRLYVQSQRPGQEPSTSILEIDGLDLLDIFEQYYRKSEQAPPASTNWRRTASWACSACPGGPRVAGAPAARRGRGGGGVGSCPWGRRLAFSAAATHEDAGSCAASSESARRTVRGRRWRRNALPALRRALVDRAGGVRGGKGRGGIMRGRHTAAPPDSIFRA